LPSGTAWILDEHKLRNFYYEPHEIRGYRLYRRVLVLEKGGLLGKIAHFKLIDFIVLDMPLEELLPLIKPLPDVMMQRFLLPGNGKMITKSFWLGLKGWAHIAFFQGKEKLFDDMRNEVRQAMTPSNLSEGRSFG